MPTLHAWDYSADYWRELDFSTMLPISIGKTSAFQNTTQREGMTLSTSCGISCGPPTSFS
jgi:hypothetical protein